jgi:hypothetical protein
MEYTITVDTNSILFAIGALALVFFGAFGLGYETAQIKFYRYLAEWHKDAKDILHGERNLQNVKRDRRNGGENVGA